jgi:HK97 gp10 family phage protein
MTEVSGMEELLQNFEKLKGKYTDAVAKALVESAVIVQGDSIKSIQTKSPGHEVMRYREGGRAYTHTASRPGDAPNTDTGGLVRSIKTEVKAKDVFVGTSLRYGKHLEYGTQHTAARPWLLPALERNRKAIKERVGVAMKRAID